MSVTVHHGDCLDVLRGMGEASVDSVVTDPPYHLTSIVKRFGGDNAAPAKSNGATGVYGRASAGFMGKQWDGGDVAFRPETWAEVLRVMKPGAHLVAFGGTRTYHRMVCAIEDAGFEVRDQLAWLYGSGFPKSHDIGKAIDRAAGAEREVVGEKRSGVGRRCREGGEIVGAAHVEALKRVPVTASATPEAARWAGWGTALKPAHEPIVLARKPLACPTVAAQVLATGTGALNIDATRIPCTDKADFPAGIVSDTEAVFDRGKGRYADRPRTADSAPGARWPANLCHDGSPEVLAAFEKFGKSESPSGPVRQGGHHRHDVGLNGDTRNGYGVGYGDEGSPARFFYSAKASKAERAGSKHPTVKPQALLRWLCRLITPPGGLILDPFAGSGSLGEAALLEGFGAVLVEREAEHVADIRRRLGRASGADTPLLSETAA